jgi:outer membrane protein OmpA-like peptidoglycan-associated protein
MIKRICFSLHFALALSALALGQSGGDLQRKTIAITYLRDPVKVYFAGTTLRPSARGEAIVERWRKRNQTEIDVTVENLIPPYNYGADYTTYVLWAITPEGQVSNLGEFRLSGDRARLKAATPYQTFAMIVTAEPHYLVKLPSRMVVLENLAPISKNVRLKVSDIYFTGDSGKYYADATPPQVAGRDYEKTPMELLQARRAVEIARLAEGEQYAPDDYRAAVRALEQAEEAFRRRADNHEVGRIAREAISLAARARDMAEERAAAAARRREIARRDEEVRRASEAASELEQQLRETEIRLKASEMARTSAEDQLNRALSELAQVRAENSSLHSENERLQDEMDRLKRELEAARAQIADLESRLSSTSARLGEATSKLEVMELESRRREFDQLRSALSQIVSVKPRGNGFVATLPDSFFLANRTDLALRAKPKMDALAAKLAAHKEVVFSIEGHSDSRPDAESFALGRAQAVADYLVALGVPRSNFRIDSHGSSSPLASNKTPKGRALNRRVELIFMGPDHR